MRDFDKIRITRLHRHAWLWEPLEGEATFVLRSMFGAKAVYLDGKLMFCFAAKEEPWCGMLVATDQSHHASLIEEIPGLSPHPVLPKWLYLSETLGSFEQKAESLVRLARRRDRRIGVWPRPRKRRRDK